MAAEFPDEDLTSFLAAEGFDIAYADSGVGVLPSQELFARGQGRRPAEDLEELPLTDEARLLLGTHVAHPRWIPRLRHTVAAEIARLADYTDLLDLDADALDGVRLGVSELTQNALRYAGGIERITLARTPSSKLYVGVHNLAPNYPDEVVQHERRGQRPLILGRGMPHNVKSNLPTDEHGWGTFLMGQFVLDRGSFEVNYPGLPEVKITNEQGRAIGSTPLKQLVVWNLFGRSADTGAARPLPRAA